MSCLFNSYDPYFKQPFGALRAGQTVRLTLTFDNDIGIGFFKGTTIPTKTRRARFLFDKLGNLLANYPILK